MRRGEAMIFRCWWWLWKRAAFVLSRQVWRLWQCNLGKYGANRSTESPHRSCFSLLFHFYRYFLSPFQTIKFNYLLSLENSLCSIITGMESYQFQLLSQISFHNLVLEQHLPFLQGRKFIHMNVNLNFRNYPRDQKSINLCKHQFILNFSHWKNIRSISYL